MRSPAIGGTSPTPGRRNRLLLPLPLLHGEAQRASSLSSFLRVNVAPPLPLIPSACRILLPCRSHPPDQSDSLMEQSGELVKKVLGACLFPFL